MTQYTDYAFYSSFYHGKLKENEFEDFISRACAYLDTLTFDRLKKHQESVTEEVKMAVCALIDEMQRQDKVRKEGRVSSFNNDGYTESLSYGNDSRSDPRKLREASAVYLANTGLLYRGCYDANGHGNRDLLSSAEG